MTVELSRGERRIIDHCLSRGRAHQWLEGAVFGLILVVMVLLGWMFYRFFHRFAQVAASEQMSVRQALHFDPRGATATTAGQAQLIEWRTLFSVVAFAIVAIACSVMFGILVIQRHHVIRRLAA